MAFLHGGRPPVVRQATYQPPAVKALSLESMKREQIESTLSKILSSPSVARKHWIIRQYDHEVQAGSVVKPLVGPSCNGPSDAAVVRPKLNSNRGIVLSCGMNPNYGDFDPYHMATSAMDEAVRNAVAVGADPSKLACWTTSAGAIRKSLIRWELLFVRRSLAMIWPFNGRLHSSAERIVSTMNSRTVRRMANEKRLLFHALC